MGTTLKIWLALGIAIIMAVLALWQIANVRGMRARGRRRAAQNPAPAPRGQQRSSDSRALSGPEKRLFAESQRLLGQGKVQPAARILEQLGMQREAIQVLEDQGLIHDAAKILMRMQRHNRAGVVYARHGMWEHAAQCFKMANMPLEVAKCAREAGDLAMAAEHFEKVNRLDDAAECYEQLGDFHRAARIFSNAGQKQRAMAMYNRLGAASENINAVEFDEQEVQQIINYLADGNTDKGLAAVMVARNKLTEVIGNLLTKGLIRPAAELYTRSTIDIGPMLMSEVSYQSGAAEALAEVFTLVAAHHYAGMVFERMNAFERAGEAFEEAEDFERAAYCFERAGKDAKVKPLKEKAKQFPYRGGKEGRNSNFALSNIASSANNPSFSEGSNESTQMVEVPPPPPGARVESDDEEGDDDLSEQLAKGRAPTSAPPPPPSPKTPVPRGNFSLGERGERAASEEVAQILESKADNAAAPDVPPPPISQSNPPTPLEPGAPVPLEDGRSAFHRARFFADLDFEQKNRIWAIGETLRFDAEETILTYNDEPQGVYVIIKGSVSCYKQVGGKEAYVDQMGEAESFGELWLLADQPTAVRFVASKDTRIRVIGRDGFTELLDNDGTIARKLYKRFTMRLLKRLLRPQNNTKNQQAS